MTQAVASSPLPTTPFRVALIGAGKVGTAVATLLQRQGHSIVGVSSRTAASAKRASERLSAPLFKDSLPDADVVLLGVPDANIAEVTEALTTYSVLPPLVVHFAGAHGIGPLLPVIRLGAAGCALHPVQTCPDVDTAILRLPGSAWGLTCTEGIGEWAQRLIYEDLKGFPVEVAEEHRAIWHAAATVTSSGIAAMMGSGEALLGSIGVENPISVLKSLATATLANAWEKNASDPVMTGPIARGDLQTLKHHAKAIRQHTPELIEHYRLIASVIASSARQAGHIDEDIEARLKKVL